MAKTDRTWDLLQEMNRKLDTHGETLAGLRADAKHAEDDIAEAKALAKSAKGDIGKLKITMARWGGIAAGILGVLEVFHRLVK